jgi:hypothetical protein
MHLRSANAAVEVSLPLSPAAKHKPYEPALLPSDTLTLCEEPQTPNKHPRLHRSLPTSAGLHLGSAHQHSTYQLLILDKPSALTYPSKPSNAPSKHLSIAAGISCMPPALMLFVCHALHCQLHVTKAPLDGPPPIGVMPVPYPTLPAARYQHRHTLHL